MDDFEVPIEVVGQAADVIDTLVRYNQNLQFVAAKGVTTYRLRLQEAIKHQQRLDNEIDLLAQEKMRLQRLVVELKNKLAAKDIEVEILRDLLWLQPK